MKEEILEYFKDIDHAYNDCTRFDTLKRMLDELQEPKTDVLNKIKEEIKNNTYFINETTEKEGIDFETVERIIDKYRRLY